ncbi:MAG TPA: hypothetical protein VFG33_16705 [Kribbella sp.]|uniref:hypothetical protein n=1 Tax=Kribbella sp. TaxID=1871183 RepID=UPI002D7763EA|nr:hypothetical protein [Kribbella sp.]HET6295026.1 hypothetical protein [Kribbella sp.]
MWRSSSGEHSRAIDELPEEIMMLLHTAESVRAEIEYRQARIKRDFQRPAWFSRKAAKAESPQRLLHPVRARHAM